MHAGQPEEATDTPQHLPGLPGSRPAVCAVVVNYRSAAETLRCVESLRRSHYDRLGIVVVDNASPDGSAALLRAKLAGSRTSEVGTRKSENSAWRAGSVRTCKSITSRGFASLQPRPPGAAHRIRQTIPLQVLSSRFGPKPELGPTEQPVVQALERAEPWVEVIGGAQNLGFGAGANAGIRRALEAGAELVWLLTPDVLVEPQTLPCLVRVMQQDAQLGVCGPVIRAGRRSITGCRLWPWMGFYARLRTAGPEMGTRSAPLLPTDYVDGGCMLVRSELLREIGLLREDFFLYYEDAEFCLRARRAGWRLAVVGSARTHTRPLNVDRNDRTYYLVRNSLWLARLEKRFLLRTLARHVLQAVWHAWRHTWCVSRPAGDQNRSRPGPNHQQAVCVLRATWQGLRAGLSRR